MQDTVQDIAKTVHKYRRQFPFLKVYVCHDPARWDASRAARIVGTVRVQLNLGDSYESRIYTKTIKPRSDKTIVEIVDKMCRGAIRDRVKSLKEKLRQSRDEVRKARGAVAETNKKVKEARDEIRNLTKALQDRS